MSSKGVTPAGEPLGDGDDGLDGRIRRGYGQGLIREMRHDLPTHGELGRYGFHPGQPQRVGHVPMLGPDHDAAGIGNEPFAGSPLTVGARLGTGDRERESLLRRRVALDLHRPVFQDGRLLELEALAATGTDHLSCRLFATLSGGEKQRVIIASALAQFEAGGRGAREAETATRYLLLDEPTASLDLHYQLEIAALLRRLNDTRGLGIVVSTHDLNLAASLCDELVLLRDGRVVAVARRATCSRRKQCRRCTTFIRMSFHDEAGRLTVVPLRPSKAARA